MTKWSVFHTWWKNKEEEPVCPNDDYPLFPGIDEYDDPGLRCIVCGTKVSLGSNFYREGGL